MDKELEKKLDELKKLFKPLQEIQQNTSMFFRGHFVSLFVLLEQSIDILIAANLCDDLDDDRSHLVIAIMEFIRIDNKITIINYILNKNYTGIINTDSNFKHLRNEHGNNNIITALKKANEIRNSFSHHIIDTPEESVLLPFKIDMFKRTGLRNNSKNMPEIIEFKNAKSFSLKELKEYTKELTELIYILMNLSKERIGK